MSSPPISQTILRNDNNDDGQTNDVQIVQLTPAHFAAAHQLEVEFASHHKGCCFGICPFAWCPSPREEFDAVYQTDLSRRGTYGVALSHNQEVLGICKARRYGQKMEFSESLFHKPKPGEFYVDSLMVSSTARGMGVGTKLLQWAEDMARQMGDSSLELGVMKGNPAFRLYQRFGFQETERDPCCAGCMIGRPHGSMVGIWMVKKL